MAIPEGHWMCCNGHMNRNMVAVCKCGVSVNDELTRTCDDVKPSDNGTRERLEVQLAGCSVAAKGYAVGKNDCEKGDYGWSQSFEDVKELRKDYDNLRSAQRELVMYLKSIRTHVAKTHDARLRGCIEKNVEHALEKYPNVPHEPKFSGMLVCKDPCDLHVLPVILNN